MVGIGSSARSSSPGLTLSSKYRHAAQHTTDRKRQKHSRGGSFSTALLALANDVADLAGELDEASKRLEVRAARQAHRLSLNERTALPTSPRQSAAHKSRSSLWGSGLGGSPFRTGGERGLRRKRHRAKQHGHSQAPSIPG